MSTKTIYKRIALVAVAALGAGVLSVAPANAADDGKIKATQGIVLPTVYSATATASGVVGGQVSFKYDPQTTTATTYITTDGKSTIVGADIDGGAAWAKANSLDWSAGAVQASLTDAQVSTIKLTSATAGTSVVTVSTLDGTTGVRTPIATLTVSWVTGTNTNLGSVSAYITANATACATDGLATIAAIASNAGDNAAKICIVGLNGAGLAYTQNTPTVSVIGNGITSLTSGKAAVDAPTFNASVNGTASTAINSNLLSGKAVYTISVTATNADGVGTTTKTTTASLGVYGTFTSITLAADFAAMAASGTGTISYTAKDGAAQATALTLAAGDVYIESDKGTVPVSADAIDNATASASSYAASGVTASTGASDTTGKVTLTAGAVYEKLTVWVVKKNALGATITSNKVVVYVSTATVKSLVLDATASATGGMTYKVQALSDPAVTGTAYPVVDGETVTLGASAGILTANSVATDKTGFASTTLYPPALGSTVTLYATTGSGATLVSGSKSIANTVTSEISSLTTLVNSLIAKINALNKLVIKIQKKVRA